jgi:hypothetical protein
MYAGTGTGIGVALLIVTGKDKIYTGGNIALKVCRTGTLQRIGNMTVKRILSLLILPVTVGSHKGAGTLQRDSTMTVTDICNN